MKQLYQINGMHCESCISKITKALQGYAKIINVTLNPPQVYLEGDNIADFTILNKAISKAGDYSLQLEIPEASSISADKIPQSWLKTYYPLFLIISLISVASFKGAHNYNDWMMHFMAGFFIVFGFFKLLDLRGFQDAYATYDLLAKRWRSYGLIYPFLELALGFAFLFHFCLTTTLWFSIALMSFSSLGVIKALAEKRKIRCACLGTVLNLPMSTITLIEDLGMVIMAITMLIV